MTKKCKFEVDVTYNSDFFAEGEIRETIKKAIRDLNDAKENKFGKRIMCDPGKTNNGISCNVNQLAELKNSGSIDLVETLVSLSSGMDDDEHPSIVLPDHKLEELMTEVHTTFKD
tara:strand:- start:76 stop:420 length:345 start_codon:yes stop_codon:yes gene_type:complete